MTSTLAHRILSEMFPDAGIVEVQGNPNALGWYLFTVDGCYCWVDTDGCVIQETDLAAA